jgi:hypothetical protein
MYRPTNASCADESNKSWHLAMCSKSSIVCFCDSFWNDDLSDSMVFSNSFRIPNKKRRELFRGGVGIGGLKKARSMLATVTIANSCYSNAINLIKSPHRISIHTASIAY